MKKYNLKKEKKRDNPTKGIYPSNMEFLHANYKNFNNSDLQLIAFL